MSRIAALSMAELFRDRRAMVALGLAFAFLAAILFASYHQLYLAWLVAPALALLLLALFSIERFLLLILFLSPLSIQLRFLVPSTPVDMFLPTEIMMVVAVILIFNKFFREERPGRSVICHPVTTLIAAMLAWYLVTSLSGTMPGVSLKATAARTWFIVSFYFAGAMLASRPGFAVRALSSLIAGIVPVSIYHLVRMWKAGIFNQQASHITAWPFFNDHTSFGAALSLLLPVAAVLAFTQTRRVMRFLFSSAFIVLLVALVLSYSRAAWISMAAGTVFGLLLVSGVPWRVTVSAVIIAAMSLLAGREAVTLRLQSVSSSSSTELNEHLRSAANITTDASNLERINRWRSALRMFEERPLTGWGPGTYQFIYAPYQLSTERTIISTNFGDRGNAHSEYLGALAETGVPGALLYIALLVAIFSAGEKRFRQARSARSRLIIAALLTGLATYVIHGALNNFLDTDKVSAPFWLFMALVLFMPTGESEPGMAADGA